MNSWGVGGGGGGGAPPTRDDSSSFQAGIASPITEPPTSPHVPSTIAASSKSDVRSVRSDPQPPHHPPRAPPPRATPPRAPPPLGSRQRSASAAVVSSVALSTTPSFIQFRSKWRRILCYLVPPPNERRFGKICFFLGSPNRFRDVEARDLTGVVQPINLLPTTRTENCDVWKSEWTGSFGKRQVRFPARIGDT